jgi:ATP:ADP antiporter, AAA family
MTKVTLWRAGEGGHVPVSHVDEKLPGNALDGFRQIFRSPFLIGVALFVLLLTSANTILYIEQNRVVGTFVASPDARTALFGKIDFGVQLAALLGQMFLFGPLMRRLGFSIMLAASPILAIGAFLALWISPSLSVIVAAMVVRRVSEYAFAKPSRDMLFTGVSRSEKYRAKSVLDTFVYRGGDAVSASAYQGATGIAGQPIAGVSGMAVSAIWLVISLWLAGGFPRQAGLHRADRAQIRPDPKAVLNEA